VSKVPGLAVAFIILPAISQSLGPGDYSEFLSALALGSVFTLFFGGINAVGRRLLAAAYGAHNKIRQANIFITATSVAAAVALTSASIVVVSTAQSWSKSQFLLICLFPILSGFLNFFDNLRASYNEHYVTSIFLLIFQVVIYAAVYAIGLPKGGILTAGLALQSALPLASAASLAILLIQRRFLLSGQIEKVREVIYPAIGVTMADGVLSALLNLGVYWLAYMHAADMTPWLGTFVRLFQTFISPILLIFFPLTSYISMRWGNMSTKRQMQLLKFFLVTGSLYGVMVGCAMAYMGPIYMDREFKFAIRGDRFDVLALSLFMGAIIAQKTYTMLLYAVYDARFVSFGSAVASTFGISVAALSRLWLPAVRVIDVLFLTVGIGVLIVLITGDHRYRSTLSRTQ